MSKITIITAVASAYAAVAATSFALGFLLAPAKAQAGESEIMSVKFRHSASPARSSWIEPTPERTIGVCGCGCRNDRLASVQVSAVGSFDLQSHKNIVVISGAAVD